MQKEPQHRSNPLLIPQQNQQLHKPTPLVHKAPIKNSASSHSCNFNPPLPSLSSSAAPSPAPSFAASRTTSSAPPSIRKIQVVYFLCRSSGQLEQPHLLEVCVPSNQGLFLKDVKSRLSAIRGNKLPSTFAWSYKRSYKNEYVWQDLCDDDLIFPAHGCDYVLKGSEIVTDGSNPSSLTIDVDGVKSHRQQQRAVGNEGNKAQVNGDLINPQQSLVTRATSNGLSVNLSAAASNPPAVSMTESGTDAATQTELDHQNGTSHEEDEEASEVHLDHIQQSSASATELDIKADMPSPPSSSSTMSSSPYNICIKKGVAAASERTMMVDRRNPKEAIVERGTVVGTVDDDDDEEETGTNDLDEDDEQNSGYRSVSNLIKKHTSVGAVRSVEKSESAAIMKSKNRSTTNFAGSEGETNNTNTNQTHLLHELLHQSPTSTPTSSTFGQKLQRSADNYGDQPSSLKQQCNIQSATLSLLQFMSCGRSEIRDQILPMSLYRLRSCKSSASASDDVVDDVVSIADSVANPHELCRSFESQSQRSNSSWLKGSSSGSKSMSSGANNQRLISSSVSDSQRPVPGVNDSIASPDMVGSGETNNQKLEHQHNNNRYRHIQSDPAMIPSGPQSDRNSHTLDPSNATDNYPAQMNKNPTAAVKESGGLHTRKLSIEAMNYMWKSSPLKLGSSCKELATANAAASHSSNLLMQRSSGELIHCNYMCSSGGTAKSSCSPLFVPGKQYINAGVQLELLSKPCYNIHHHLANPPLPPANPRMNDNPAPNHKPNPVSSTNSGRKTGDVSSERV